MAISILIGIEDGKTPPRISTMQINVPSSVSVTNAVAFGTQIAQLVEPLLAGRIRSVGVSIDLPVPTDTLPLYSISGADSDVEEGAKFVFNTSGGFLTSTRIPTFREDLLVSGSREVDQTDPDVAAFVAAMVSGLTVNSTLVTPSDQRNEDIVSLRSALEDFVKSRA